MAQTIADIIVTSDAWTDISSVSGITVGTKYDIQNKGVVWVDLYEGGTEPILTEESGRYISSFPNPTSKANILTGSLKIWAKARATVAYKKAKINVQEV